MNHISSEIYPVLLDDGSRRWISFADLGGTADGRVAVRPATGSRELDAALIEHWIALAQLALAPQSEKDVQDLFENPATRERLIEASTPWVPYFEVFGPVRAFQDPGAAEAGAYPVSTLFVDAPGEQAITRNTDISAVGPRRVDERIAVLALAHLQRHSPAGGRGTKTSATGGGPLRTLVWFDDLRKTVVANLLPKRRFLEPGLDTDDPAALFPWLRVSTGSVTPQDAPATHLYFPVIRRIYLEPSRAAEPGEICDVTGLPAERFVETVRKLPGGPDYDSTNWRHPLTPYTRRKDKGRILSFPKLAATVQGRVSWRDRVGLFQPAGSADGEGLAPAAIVREWHDGGRCDDLDLARVSVWAYGHACDNAKVVSWVDSRTPFLAVPADVRDVVESELAQCVEVANQIASNLRRALRSAYYSVAAQKKLTREFLASQVEQFWADTERDFETLVGALTVAVQADGPGGDFVRASRNTFGAALKRCAEAIFDSVTQDDLPDAPEQITTARRILGGANTKFLKALA